MNELSSQLTNDLLKEIFIKPANEIKINRFNKEATEATCNGQCVTGMCRSL